MTERQLGNDRFAAACRTTELHPGLVGLGWEVLREKWADTGAPSDILHAPCQLNMPNRRCGCSADCMKD